MYSEHVRQCNPGVNIYHIRMGTAVVMWKDFRANSPINKEHYDVNNRSDDKVVRWSLNAHCPLSTLLYLVYASEYRLTP